jgi:Holliday junction resolvase RusA-like endonuclease
MQVHHIMNLPAITFVALGEPKGQPRPRAFARKMGGKYVARVFESGTAEGWKSCIAQAAAPVRPAAPFTGPILLKLTFHMPRPRGHFVGSNLAKGLKPSAPVWHTGKPDNDNLQKAVMDAITQLGGFWHDDSQVARVSSRKIYSIAPGCLVEIAQMKETE